MPLRPLPFSIPVSMDANRPVVVVCKVDCSVPAGEGKTAALRAKRKVSNAKIYHFEAVTLRRWLRGRWPVCCSRHNPDLATHVSLGEKAENGCR